MPRSGSVSRGPVLGAVEDVAPVAHPVRPGHEHLPAEGVVGLARADGVEQLVPADGPRAQRGADRRSRPPLPPVLGASSSARRRGSRPGHRPTPARTPGRPARRTPATPSAWRPGLSTWWCGPPSRSQASMHSRTPDVGAEEAVGHLERRQLVGVEDLALGRRRRRKRSPPSDDERRQRAGPGRVLEEERRRVARAPPMPERALDQPDRAVVARQRPVALAHVAHQDRVAREVHRVHLGELRRRRAGRARRPSAPRSARRPRRRSRSPWPSGSRRPRAAGGAKRPSSAIASKWVE